MLLQELIWTKTGYSPILKVQMNVGCESLENGSPILRRLFLFVFMFVQPNLTTFSLWCIHPILME